MKVVITGGSGFLGSNLTLWLQRNEPDTKIVIYDIVPPTVSMGVNTEYVYGDIRNLNRLLQVFEGADEVYNLAGILGTSELIDISSLAVDVNVTGAANVFDAAKIRGVSRIYNVAKPHFDGYFENTYTLTKHAAELLGLMYREQYDMSVATVRWLNAVGPHQHLFPVRKFVPTMVLLAMHGLPLEIYGSGNQTIDPIDVRDLSRFTVYACRNLGGLKEVVDLGSGVSVSCNDAADVILKEVQSRMRTNSEIIHVDMRLGEADDVSLVADCSYWESIGMRTVHDFQDSVASVVDYMMNLPDTHLHNALKFYGHTSAA